MRANWVSVRRRSTPSPSASSPRAAGESARWLRSGHSATELRAQAFVLLLEGHNASFEVGSCRPLRGRRRCGFRWFRWFATHHGVEVEFRPGITLLVGEVDRLSARTRQEAVPRPMCGTPTRAGAWLPRCTVADVPVDGRRVVVSAQVIGKFKIPWRRSGFAVSAFTSWSVAVYAQGHLPGSGALGPRNSRSTIPAWLGSS